MANQAIAACNDAIASALSLCQLGTTSYDGSEVMTDEQQENATVAMLVANNAAQMLHDRLHGADTQRFAAEICAWADEFNGEASAILNDVVANAGD